MEKENALKILRELHDKALFSERTALETFIPELKESEDERIREQIIYAINKLNVPESEKSKLLAWLEKQGVQKPGLSEEDQNALEDVREAVVHYWGGETQDILLYWLKSLKQRIAP